MHFIRSNTLFIALTLCLLFFNFRAFAIEKLSGAWFECEFVSKTTKPTDDCNMLDNDGFIFKNNIATHISVIDSQEINCKKNKFGQCFKSDLKSIKISKGRQDKVKFEDSKLTLTFLGCGQVFHIANKGKYVVAKPDAKKCFWAGKKVFYLKKYDGELIF